MHSNFCAEVTLASKLKSGKMGVTRQLTDPTWSTAGGATVTLREPRNWSIQQCNSYFDSMGHATREVTTGTTTSHPCTSHHNPISSWAPACRINGGQILDRFVKTNPMAGHQQWLVYRSTVLAGHLSKASCYVYIWPSWSIWTEEKLGFSK